MKKSKSYTITEAAKHLGISRQAVHEAIRKGLLKAAMGEIEVVQTRVSKVRGWLVSPDALKAYQVSEFHQTAGKKIASA